MRASSTLTAFVVAALIAGSALAQPATNSEGAVAQGPYDAEAHERAAAPVRAQLARHFLQPFELYASEHFVILHDTSVARAAGRAQLLERTYQRFYEAFSEAGFELDQPRQPLVCVLFADQDDFAYYAKQVDWVDMSWSGGYYSSRTNRVALFEVGFWQEDGQGHGGGHGPDHGADASATSATPRMSRASTTHEAAHQLAFNSGLQRRGVMYPLWASEGLATAFEGDDHDADLDDPRNNTTRRRDLRRALATGRLLPLEQFVTLTRVPTDDPQMVNVVYAQAWDLFRFLLAHERDGLMRYLAHLSRLERGPRPPATLRAEFMAAFGSIAEIEQRWHASLREPEWR